VGSLPLNRSAGGLFRPCNGDLQMITRRTFAAIAIALTAATVIPAFAATRFTPAALAEAQKAGKSILVEVSAPWCSVCKAQKVVLGDLGKQERFKKLVTFEVDFDTQKDALKALNVRMQSTLIVFKGDKEMGRLAYDAKKESIEALLAKAL
jgi:thiol:disulfide interchange protein